MRWLQSRAAGSGFEFWDAGQATECLEPVNTVVNGTLAHRTGYGSEASRKGCPDVTQPVVKGLGDIGGGATTAELPLEHGQK